MTTRAPARSVTRELKLHAALLASLLLAMWALEAADFVLFRGGLDAYGIHPRDTSHFEGIAFAPFLHVGFAHLAGNSVPFLVLGWIILLHGVRDFAAVSFLSALVGGAGVWMVGAPGSVHLGASGVVFGFFGYLLLRGWFQRSAGAVLLSVAVGAAYGGLLFGVLPQAGISWEGHLFGFAGGGLAAWLFRVRPQPQAQLRPSL
jgi:membrane associated rhomboid family serine protease